MFITAVSVAKIQVTETTTITSQLLEISKVALHVLGEWGEYRYMYELKAKIYQHNFLVFHELGKYIIPLFKTSNLVTAKSVSRQTLTLFTPTIFINANGDRREK